MVLFRVLLTIDMCVHVRVGSHELADYWRLPHLIFNNRESSLKYWESRLKSQILLQYGWYLWKEQLITSELPRNRILYVLISLSGNCCSERNILKKKYFCVFLILQKVGVIFDLYMCWAFWLVLLCQKQPNKPNRSNESIDHSNKNKKSETSTQYAN